MSQETVGGLKPVRTMLLPTVRAIMVKPASGANLEESLTPEGTQDQHQRGAQARLIQKQVYQNWQTKGCATGETTAIGLAWCNRG